MAAQQLPPGHHGAAHAHPQRQRHHIVMAASRAPHCTGQRYAGRIVGEDGHVIRQPDQLTQAQPFQKMQGTRQHLELRAIGIDDSFATHADGRRESGRLKQPAHRFVKRW
jgi:hypothetical protein